MKYLVDTDWIIDVLNDQAAAIQTLLALAPDGLAVSLISYGEPYEGAYYGRDPQAAHASISAFLAGKQLLPLTTEIMEQFGITRGQLTRQLRQQIGDMDFLIAATALHHDLILLTSNIRDFQHIPGLKIYRTSPADI